MPVSPQFGSAEREEFFSFIERGRKPDVKPESHTTKLHKYTQYRQGILYDDMLQKISFEGLYDSHPCWPGVDVFRLLGKGSEISSLPKVRIAPTLLMECGRYTCFYTDPVSSQMVRLDNCGIKAFKSKAFLSNNSSRHHFKTKIENPTEPFRAHSSKAANSGCGRLNRESWIPLSNSTSEYTSIAIGQSFDTLRFVHGVLVSDTSKTGSVRNHRHLSYTVSYSRDGCTWMTLSGTVLPSPQTLPPQTSDYIFKEGKVFFPVPIQAAHIRIHPLTWGSTGIAINCAVVVESIEKTSSEGIEPVAIIKRPTPNTNSTISHTLTETQVGAALQQIIGGMQVIQQFVKSKGNHACVYRAVWKANNSGRGITYQITSKISKKDMLIDADARYLASQENDNYSDRGLTIVPLRCSSCQEIVNQTGDIAKLLQKRFCSVGRIEVLAADWVRDTSGLFYFTQIKGWKIRQSTTRILRKPISTNYGRYCAMCRKRFVRDQYSNKLTANMISKALNQKRLRNLSKSPLPSQRPNGISSKYETQAVCQQCYIDYNEEGHTAYREAKLATAVGVKTTYEVTTTTNTSTSVFDIQPTLNDVITTSATGLPSDISDAVHLEPWLLMLYFDEVLEIPHALDSENIYLKTSIFGKIDEIPVGKLVCNSRTGGGVGVMRMRPFFVKTNKDLTASLVDDDDDIQIPLNPVVSELLRVQSEINVKLCTSNNTVLGIAKFSLSQLCSGIIDEVILIKMFSGSILEKCCLKMQIGITKSNVPAPKGDQMTIHEVVPDILFPKKPYCNILSLPLRWRKIIAGYIAKLSKPQLVICDVKKESNPVVDGLIIPNTSTDDTLPASESGMLCVKYKNRTLRRRVMSRLQEEHHSAKELLNCIEREPSWVKYKLSAEVRKRDRSKKKNPLPPKQPDQINKNKFEIDNHSKTTSSSSSNLRKRLLRIQSPCPTAWGTMTGTTSSNEDDTNINIDKSMKHNKLHRSLGQCVRVELTRNMSSAPIPTMYTAWKLDVNISGIDGDLGEEETSTWTARYSLFGNEITHKGFRLIREGQIAFEGEDSRHLYCEDTRSIAAYLNNKLSGVLRVIVHNTFQSSILFVANVDLSEIVNSLRQKKVKSVPPVEGWFPLRRVNPLSSAHSPEGVLMLDSPTLSECDVTNDDVISHVSSEGEGSCLIGINISITAIDISASNLNIERDLRPEYDFAIINIS